MPDFPGEGQPADSTSLISSVVRDRFDALYQGDFKPLRARQQTTPNMTVFVESDAGRAYLDGNNPLNFAGGNSPTFTAPGAPNKRIDLLCIDKTGTLTIIQGTAAGTPVAPTYPVDGRAVLAEVYLRATSTSVKNLDDGTNGYIFKRRQPVITLGGGVPQEAVFTVTQSNPGDITNTFSRDWALLTNSNGQVVVRVYSLATSATPGGNKTNPDGSSTTRQPHDLTINHNRGRKHVVSLIVNITSSGTPSPAVANVEVQYL